LKRLPSSEPLHAKMNLLLVRITVCKESCLPIGWHTFIFLNEKVRQKGLLYFGFDCGMLEFFTHEL
jgi:hypothetical protein